MASKPGVMYDFPWEPMGNYKYLLLAPFAVAAAAGLDDSDDWCRHMVLLVLARYVLAQVRRRAGAGVNVHLEGKGWAEGAALRRAAAAAGQVRCWIAHADLHFNHLSKCPTCPAC